MNHYGWKLDPTQRSKQQDRTPPMSCLCTPGNKRPTWRIALKKEAEPTEDKLHGSYSSPSGELTTVAGALAPAAHLGLSTCA